LKNEFEIHNLRFGSKKMNVSYIRSSINRYRYFYASPSSEVSKGIQNTILTIILSTCVAIALMLMLLYYFGRWNYSSLRQIIDNSVKSDAIHIDDNSNEYLIISNWIESMKEQRESLKGNTEKLRNIQKQSFLFDYIKGYVDNTKMSGEFQQYDISFPYECFAIVAINVKNIETSKIDIVRNAIFIIDNITSDLADDSIHLTDIEADGMLYYIVNAPKDLDVEANMRQLFLYIAAFLRKNFEFTFLTTISTSAYSVHELPRLYREAFSAMEYGIYYEIDEFVSYSEIKNEGHSHFLDACRIPNESSLLYAIKNSRYDEAVEIICNLLSQNANGKHLQEWQLNCLTYNLINSIIKSLDYAEKEALDKIFNYTAMIANCSNINELKTFFEELIKLCVECNLAQIKTEDSTYQKIKNFIEQNITNTVLSPVWIGQKLNLSPTHILRLFKNHNGIKLNSYLNARRIELAKEILLRNRNLKVDVVAMSVGFLNVRTFLATFKEIEGITPTQYRSVNK
jgi:AraC-like DNA-binding protein